MNIQCPHCNQTIEAPPEMAGKTASCPACQGVLQIPIPQAVHSQPPVAAVLPETNVLDYRIPFVDELQNAKKDEAIIESRKQFAAQQQASEKIKKIGRFFDVTAMVIFLLACCIIFVVCDADDLLPAIIATLVAIVAPIVIIGRIVTFLMKK